MVIILELSHPIVWLVRHVCSDKAEFSFLQRNLFLVLFQTCTKLTFGLFDVFVVTVIARNRINGVGSLFFRDRIRGKEREGRSADSWSTVGQQTADSIFWELFFTFTEFSQCNDMASINYYNCTQFHLWELNI